MMMTLVFRGRGGDMALGAADRINY